MYEIVLLGLVTWRESQDQPRVAQVGVAYSVKNRAKTPGWWGRSVISCILQPYQYSSFNRNDPNATKFPKEDDPSWLQCLGVAQDVWQGLAADPTSGCQNYFDKSLDDNPPEWAKDGSYVHVIDLSSIRLWRRVK